MNTVYVVMRWLLGEDEGISGIFKDKQKAQEYAEKMEAEDQWDYRYFVREWEVK